MDELREYLNGLEAGPVADVGRLAVLLARCWEQFRGSDVSKMTTRKLPRIESPMWERPILSFTIERHGGTVLGSTRATKQRWTLDVGRGVAREHEVGFRQVRPPAPRLKVEPLAESMFQLMRERREDRRLKWRADGSVRVEIGKIIPHDGPKQTVTGRRKRFRQALEERVRSAGGEIVGTNVYRLPS